MANLSEQMHGIADQRQAGKVDHLIHDACMSAFAMMFFQDPSMLAFQTRLQATRHLNNLKTLFHVESIPKATQFTTIMDELPPIHPEKAFSACMKPLQRGNQLAPFRFLDRHYLISLDGTQTLSSERLHCQRCLHKVHASGRTTYSHQVLCAALVHPDQRQVLPLAPEPIQNHDGHKKQDCEINAGKRMLAKIRQAHPKLDIIILGDSLFGKQPFVDEAKAYRMSFIRMVKPDDHKLLFQWVAELKRLGGSQRWEFKDSEGRRHLYEWVRDLPLNGTKDADHVNYFEYTLINADQTRGFFGSWITDLRITPDNVPQLVKGGRARWKIENENFNTLKNQGYHAEHNFGHGRQNAAYNYFLFILLAFLVHQILELTDPLFQTCRRAFSARAEVWNQLRCTIRLIVFSSWAQLLEFVLHPP